MSFPSRPLSVLALSLASLPPLLSPSSASAIEPKRLIVVTVTTGFRHNSIEAAERTLQKLAHNSKEFMIVEFLRQPNVVVPSRPTPPQALPEDAGEAAQKQFDSEVARYQDLRSKWTPELEQQAQKAQDEFTKQVTATLSKLAPAALLEAKIDGVIFANTSGNLPLPDKQGFIQWVEKGHALIGMHSAADTLRQFSGYTNLLGAEFAGHGSQSPLDLTAKDTTHPAVTGLPNPWRIKMEEFYHFAGYDRSRVHDLWSSSKHPFDKRSDQGRSNHFPVSWTRTQGAGKVFYTSLGHREDLWDESKDLPSRTSFPALSNPPEVSIAFQKHILGGILWALNLEDGDSDPQVKE